MIKTNQELCALINAHWEYVNSLLEAHGVDDDERDIISFHYMSAFEHGYKHAARDIADEVPRGSSGGQKPTYADEYKIDPQDPRCCPTCMWWNTETAQCGYQFPELCGKENSWRKWQGRPPRG
jgi:hypothetical protein